MKGSNDCSGGQPLCTVSMILREIEFLWNVIKSIELYNFFQGNVATSPQNPGPSEKKYGGLNFNVMNPENQKLSKAGFGDTDKIQNIG